ncbi:hypothetical protein D9K64_01325 [Klebsiella pneumoniae]|nr:hypothetical protein D9K64_01325 [Klebsiella pneumoniae]
MPLITKNFRLNGLANQYAAAVYARVQQNNGGDFFEVQAGPQAIQVNLAVVCAWLKRCRSWKVKFVTCHSMVRSGQWSPRTGMNGRMYTALVTESACIA